MCENNLPSQEPETGTQDSYIDDAPPSSENAALSAPDTIERGKPKPKPVKKHRFSTPVRIIVMVGASLMTLVALLLIAAGSYTWYLLDRIDYTDTYQDVSFPADYFEEEDPSAPPEESSTVTPTVDPVEELADIPLRGNTDDVTNVLLLGIDGTSYSARSDTNIILSINKKTKTIKLVSLMRDTKVLIPGYDFDKDGLDDFAKLNVAFASGGTERLYKTIEKNFRLKIDKYVGVNFTVFPIVVDKLGGIDIYLSRAESTQVPAKGTTITAETFDPRFKPLANKAGTYHLDGFQTLQYSRIRHLDSDFGRAERQQKVISILIEKIKGTSVLSLTGMLNDLLPQVRTDMGKNELLDYAIHVGDYVNYEVKSFYHLPQKDMYKFGWLRKASVIEMTDLRQSVLDLHEYLYGEDSSD